MAPVIQVMMMIQWEMTRVETTQVQTTQVQMTRVQMILTAKKVVSLTDIVESSNKCIIFKCIQQLSIIFHAVDSATTTAAKPSLLNH